MTGLWDPAGYPGLSLVPDLFDGGGPGCADAVWALAHLFGGGGLWADEPVVLHQVAWRAEVELAGDQAADGQAGGLQGHEWDGGLVAVSAEAGEADGLGEAAHWLAQVRCQHLLLSGGQMGDVFLCERGIAQHGPFH